MAVAVIIRVVTGLVIYTAAANYNISVYFDRKGEALEASIVVGVIGFGSLAYFTCTKRSDISDISGFVSGALIVALALMTFYNLLGGWMDRYSY